MKNILFALVLVLPALAHAGGSCPRAFADALRDARKLVLMTGDGFNTPTGSIRLFSRADAQDAWTEESALLPDRRAVFGLKGLAWGEGFTEFRTGKQLVKKEGDRRSPIGAFRLGIRFGFAAAGNSQYLPLTPGIECVDDPQSRHYNTIVDARAVKKDWKSAEKMRAEPLYERGINVEYNSGRKRGAGSCIFLHHWRTPREGTAGCGAMNPKSMERLHAWLGEAVDGVLVTIPRAELTRIQGCL